MNRLEVCCSTMDGGHAVRRLCGGVGWRRRRRLTSRLAGIFSSLRCNQGNLRNFPVEEIHAALVMVVQTGMAGKPRTTSAPSVEF